MSIFIFYKFNVDSTIFIRFWRHFLQFLSRLMSDSTTFKVAVSHFVFYPCGALNIVGPVHPLDTNAASQEINLQAVSQKIQKQT